MTTQIGKLAEKAGRTAVDARDGLRKGTGQAARENELVEQRIAKERANAQGSVAAAQAETRRAESRGRMEVRKAQEAADKVCLVKKTNTYLWLGLSHSLLLVAIALMGILSAGSPNYMRDHKRNVGIVTGVFGLIWLFLIFAAYRVGGKHSSRVLGKISGVVQVLGALTITVLGWIVVWQGKDQDLIK